MNEQLAIELKERYSETLLLNSEIVGVGVSQEGDSYFLSILTKNDMPEIHIKEILGDCPFQITVTGSFELLSNMECPECGEKSVSTVMTPHTFNYGAITVELPLRVCGECKFQYLDYVGQKIQDEAFRNHLDKTGKS